MSDECKVVPYTETPESPVDLNIFVEQAKKITADLDHDGIVRATYKSGVVFHRDEKSNTATVAGNGLIVEQREHTTTVTFRHTNSSERQAIEELASARKATQEVLGAFSGRSQPWASQALSHDDSDE